MNRLDIVKIVCVATIGGVLLIPLSMIRGLVAERSAYRDQTRRGVAQAWTGPQAVLGPILSVPGRSGARVDSLSPRKQHGRDYRFPETLTVKASMRTERRGRGLYSIPVYVTTLQFDGEFDIAGMEFYDEVDLSLAVSDSRGIVQLPTITWGDVAQSFAPGSRLPGLDNGMHARVPVIGDGTRRPFTIVLELRGMSRLEFAPIARDTNVEITGDWTHPSFFGRFLPVEQKVEGGQFHASWHVPHIASGAQQTLDQLLEGDSQRLSTHTFGVELFEPIDHYHQSMRAVKYGILFVILTFTAFFLVELTRHLRLHPMHYLLVGLGLTIFFLLLTSLSEHVEFWQAYVLAAIGCVGLIGGYLAAVLGKRTSGATAGVALGGLYGMLYVILLSEQNALLMGSLLLFLTLAVVMYVTRRLDWYSIGGVAKIVPPLDPASTQQEP